MNGKLFSMQTFTIQYYVCILYTLHCRCTLNSLLAPYRVKLPVHLMDTLSASVFLPYEEIRDNIQTIGNEVGRVGDALFQPPDKRLYLKLSCLLTLNTLEKLVKELKRFLMPLDPYMNMMVYFTLHRSVLFDTYLRHNLEKIKQSQQEGTREEYHCGLQMTFPDLDASTSSDEKSVLHPLMILKEALHTTQELLLQVVLGKAAYSDITADESLNLKDENINFKLEFEVLSRSTSLLRCKRFKGQCGKELAEMDDVSHHNEVFHRVQSLLELLQFEQHLSNIKKVLNEYNLSGCLEDENFIALTSIMPQISSRTTLTPLLASEKLGAVKAALCLQHDSQGHCLRLFPIIYDCKPFYEFIMHRKFGGERGQENFTTQYELVTTQLQHERYNELVLNHLGAAFKIMHPFTCQQQSLENLMMTVQRFDVTNAINQLRTVKANLTQVQVWFTRTEVCFIQKFH